MTISVIPSTAGAASGVALSLAGGTALIAGGNRGIAQL